MTQCFYLSPDGKVIPGVTILRDDQTGRFYDIMHVMRSEMETPLSPEWRTGSRDEKSALNGGGRTHGARGAV